MLPQRRQLHLQPLGDSPTCSITGHTPLEQFKKYHSHSEAVLFAFGFVSTHSQAAEGMLIHQSLAKIKKPSLSMATLFFKTL
jgi:hypothetical protein